MDELVHRILWFDRFALDLTRGCLRTGGRELELPPKPFRMLHHLVENAGRLVVKEELQKSVWGHIVVSDDSLVQCIRQLRRTLGDDERRLIKTVSRRGYLLDAQVFDHQPARTPGSPLFTAGEVKVLSPLSGEVLARQPKAMGRDILAGERKLVTVLYADVKETLESCAERDPEQALTVFEAVLKIMTQAVLRYDGTVHLVTTDGIFALFGAPRAQEDHAIRACNAALQIRQAIGCSGDGSWLAATGPMRVRVGLNSGEVVIRPIDRGGQYETRAMGPTMHAASRLGQRAKPGQLLLSEATRRLLEGHVEVRRDHDRSADGPVFELAGIGPARTRFQARVARGLTRLVGRDAELEQLHRISGLVLRGQGQVVALVADAGVGKSRLAYEFTRSRELQGWRVLEGDAVSYGMATSYLPVVTLLKAYFEIRDHDDPCAIGNKVRGKLLALDPALASTLPAILALLDVPLEASAGRRPAATWQALAPAERRLRTHDAVKRLLLREARKQPLLVIVEDLHWIDGETQALLDGLVESLGLARLLLLATHRPEYQHGWGSRASYSRLRLDALPVERTAELLDGLLGNAPELTPLKQHLVKRGNPFFLEETVRTLVETKDLVGLPGRYRLTQPIGAIQVPATVQVMLAARIDRLAPDDKRLLQTASVIGKDVSYSLLQAIGEMPDDALRAGLDRLRSAEFLCEMELSSDRALSFRHALTHEVTYSGLLHERRRELHERVVLAIETLFRGRLDAHIEQLAHHAGRGGLKKKAVDYLRQAGLKAAARSALPDARHWFEQALGVLETLPESPSTLAEAFEIRLDLRPVLNLLGEFSRAIERLREAEGLAERLNDDGRRGRVCAWATNHHALLGDLDQALVSGSRALAIAGRLGDLELRVLTTTLLEEPHYFRGEYERVIELAAGNLATLAADPAGEDFGAAIPVAALPISANDHYWLVKSLAELGRFDEATGHSAELLRLAGRTRHGYTVGVAHRAAGDLHRLKGEWAQARSLCERGIAAYRRGNIGARLPSGVAASAWILAQIGETSEADGRLREGEELLERQAGRGQIHDHGWAYHALGHSALLLGRLDAAQRLADSAAKFSGRNPGSLAYVHHLRGDIATRPDCFDAGLGETHYRAAMALAEPRGMRPLVAHCHLGLGKLRQRTGDRQQRHGHLTTAVTMYGEMDMRFWLEQARAAGHRR